MNRRGNRGLVERLAELEGMVRERERELSLLALSSETREKQLSHAKRQLRGVAELAGIESGERASALCRLLSHDFHWSAAAVLRDEALVYHHNLTDREREELPQFVNHQYMKEYTQALSTTISSRAHLLQRAHLAGEFIALVRDRNYVVVAVDRRTHTGAAHHQLEELSFLKACAALLP